MPTRISLSNSWSATSPAGDDQCPTVASGAQSSSTTCLFAQRRHVRPCSPMGGPSGGVGEVVEPWSSDLTGQIALLATRTGLAGAVSDSAHRSRHRSTSSSPFSQPIPSHSDRRSVRNASTSRHGRLVGSSLRRDLCGCGRIRPKNTGCSLSHRTSPDGSIGQTTTPLEEPSPTTMRYSPPTRPKKPADDFVSHKHDHERWLACAKRRNAERLGHLAPCTSRVRARQPVRSPGRPKRCATACINEPTLEQCVSSI